MSVLFMIGASLFMNASIGFLLPNPNSSLLNITYFIGSIPFTSAAFLQLLDSSNQKGQPWRLLVYRPQNLGYKAALSQWLGTILFNFNTFDATFNLTWQQSDILVWTPNMVGSIFFMISAIYLLNDINFVFDSKNNEFNGVWINFLGCLTFLISAFASIYFPTALPKWVSNFALINTFIGALCFFLASALTLTRLPK
ncbi:hypothetical protein [Flammeovirga kamogawensis]|uniref:YrhK domain-containing protein n=1 Tax=Flammeovirga kamogawensis TaxID=373891 RepID=A0ABX8H0Z7_9BACT|nr:hypothetical protein [Flammeovirga kamogawensis]MBB6459280.1 hypothetical protein [Flammeovirga kamogawensis]QWG08840.1 hypothetical protein KM029_07835 [Flammeovirga kamogawensis]TRX67130.1 hypothetical protein EO216_02880 [Flammeovirga kamogawensis]